jgi:hypothetical protein
VSFCRWSTDDFQCDLYCYESCYGGFQTEVAGNRVIYSEPLPPEVPFDWPGLEWRSRHEKVMQMVKSAKCEPLGLPHDGESFNDETLEDFLARLLMLREAGYRFPDYVLERVREEITAMNSASGPQRSEKP